MTAYSGTPLAKKLGIQAGSTVLAPDAPDGYRDWLAPLPDGVHFVATLSPATDVIHVFTTSATVLADALTQARAAMRTDAMVWVSWPKKASKVPTDITEDTIRALALPLGLVDVKVCAVTEIWSGLKLVIRKELREK